MGDLQGIRSSDAKKFGIAAWMLIMALIGQINVLLVLNKFLLIQKTMQKNHDDRTTYILTSHMTT